MGNIGLLFWSIPFFLLLSAIAIFPLLPRLSNWWERNFNKFLISGALALLVTAYYLLSNHGFHGAEPGFSSMARMLNKALIGDYFPFIVLLFSLYTISGGIRLKGDVPAHPMVNALILLGGAVLASF